MAPHQAQCAQESEGEERARLAGLIESAMDGIITVDSEQNITLLNPAAERMFGVAAMSVRGGPLASLIPLRWRAKHAEHIRGFCGADLSNRRMGAHSDVIGVRANGEEFPIEASISHIEVNGRPFYTAILRDISRRRRAEASTEREKALTDAMIECMPGILYFQDEQGQLLRWNRNFADLSGYADGEMIGKHALEFFRGEDSVRMVRAIGEARRDGESHVEVDFVPKDGSVLRYFITCRRLVLDGAACVVSVGVDVTTRNQIEATKARLAAIVEFSNDAIIGRDTNGAVTSWNRGAERLFGYTAEEMVGEPVTRLLPTDREAEEQHILDRIQRGEVVEHLETVRKRRDGQLIEVSITVSAIRDRADVIVGTSKMVRDITEIRRLELQSRHRKKMEAIGQLTGGVAHDFNNLLGVILGNLDLIERMVAGDGAAGKRVIAAQKAAMRGADLTKRLLAFSRRLPLRPSPTSLLESIHNVVEMASRVLGPGIEIATDLDESVPPVFVDAAGLESVLLNLAINARDAMPAGGSIRISTEVRDLSHDYQPVQSGELKAGRYGCIRVRDSGQGMSRETLERAFEPFFTTKPRGKGTGLGLAAVYGFVKQSGGNTRIYSEPGVGTVVSVYLPLAESQSVVAAPAAIRSKGVQSMVGRIVLVVDDEVDLLEIAVACLEDMGCKVLHATDGPMALAIAAREPGIDLLVTDIFMPGGMNGVELANRVRQLTPRIKVVYSSGFASDALTEKSGTLVDGPLMHKPYRRSELAAAVRRVLSGDAADDANDELSAESTPQRMALEP
jgi:PAS domain S-box-containing protein